ncbi:unnamed protein product [Caenorhabditis brenneri]
MNSKSNAMEENRHGQKRKSEQNSRDDDAKQAKIIGESVFLIPKISLLEDIVEYFLQHKSSKLGFAIDIYTNRVKLSWKEYPGTYIQFEKFQRGCNVSTSDAPMEFHRNDFIDLAMTTIMRIIRAPNFQSHSMCLSQYCAHSESGNGTWVVFIKQFCKLRNAIKTFKTGTLLIAAFEKKDYEELTNVMQFGSMICHCIKDTSNELNLFRTIREADEYAERNGMKISVYLLEFKL